MKVSVIEKKNQGNREWETHPAKQVVSSSGRSPNSGPHLSHPVGLEHVVLLLDLVLL